MSSRRGGNPPFHPRSCLDSVSGFSDPFNLENSPAEAHVGDITETPNVSQTLPPVTDVTEKQPAVGKTMISERRLFP